MASPPAQAALDILTVGVGDPGNPPASDGYGSVSEPFRIGKYEVTNREYATFLNAVDPSATNTLGLYSIEMSTDAQGGIIVDPGQPDGAIYVVKSGYENLPVVLVNFYDAMRFANWLHNGQGNGDTETGAYPLEGGSPFPANGGAVTRSAGARFWIPSENEWYKAAYYFPEAEGGPAGNYLKYPMVTPFQPRSDQPPGETPPNFKAANYNYNDRAAHTPFDDGFAVTGSSVLDRNLLYLTPVGAYGTSPSVYGTFDQGGNVEEWLETRFGSQRYYRGGSWLDDGNNGGNLRAEVRLSDGANNKFIDRGFRIAAAVEPVSPPAPPSFSSFELNGSTFTLAIASLTGRQYQLEVTGSLDAAFTPAGASQPGETGKTLTFTDTSASAGRRFYRISISETP